MSLCAVRRHVEESPENRQSYKPLERNTLEGMLTIDLYTCAYSIYCAGLFCFQRRTVGVHNSKQETGVIACIFGSSLFLS